MYDWYVHRRIKLIQLDHITKTFDTGADKVHAVSDVTLHIKSGDSPEPENPHWCDASTCLRDRRAEPSP